MGKILVIIGIILIIVGVIMMYSDKMGFLGRLPGDITIEKKNFSFHFPLMTSILLSILLSFIIYIIQKLR